MIRLQPHTVFSNRTGHRLLLRQFKGHTANVLLPSDASRAFLWDSVWEQELLQARTVPPSLWLFSATPPLSLLPISIAPLPFFLCHGSSEQCPSHFLLSTDLL